MLLQNVVTFAQDLPPGEDYEHLSIMARWVREQKLDPIRAGLAPLIWTPEQIQSLEIPRTYQGVPIVSVDFGFGGRYKRSRCLQVIAHLENGDAVMGCVVDSLEVITFEPSEDASIVFYIYCEPDTEFRQLYVQALPGETEKMAVRRVGSLRNFLLGAVNQWARAMRLQN